MKFVLLTILLTLFYSRVTGLTGCCANYNWPYQPIVSEMEALYDIWFGLDGPNWLSSSAHPIILPNGNKKRDMIWFNPDRSSKDMEIHGPCGDRANTDDFHWVGIICEEFVSSQTKRHVEVLLLSYNQLQGTLTDDLGKLSWMKRLYIFGNDIQGTLPSTVNQLTRLTHMFVQNNALTSLGTGISTTTSLNKLYFEHNQISHNLNFVSTLVNLREIDGSYNLITGVLPDISNIGELTLMIFSNNQISSTLPAHYLNDNLAYVDLSNNDIYGVIPQPVWTNSSTIKYSNLDLHSNHLRCRLPSWLDTANFFVDLRDNDPFLCPVRQLPSNVVHDGGCNLITIRSSSPDTYIVGLPEPQADILTINATGIDVNCDFKCAVDGIEIDPISIVDGIMTCQLDASIFEGALAGGIKRVCIYNNGEQVSSSCTNIFLTYYCDPNKCKNGGVCYPLTGECLCTYEWTGPTCETKVCGGCNECPNGDCSNPGGYCLANGTCVCYEGWLGYHCEIGTKACNPPCVHGECNPYTGTCICEYTHEGPACDIEKCPNCFPLGSKTPACVGGLCQCLDGWTGPICNQPLLACNTSCGEEFSPAHGTCNKYAEGGPTCVCSPYWSGADCSIRLCPPYSKTIPECYGHGVCNRTDGTCICDYPYSGDWCTSVNADCIPACSENGICLRNRNPPICSCFVGYYGDTCEFKTCPNNCSYPNGICDPITGTCNCTEGWKGASCNENKYVCPNDCSGHGFCDYYIGECSCAYPYVGEDCLLASCINNCSGHGVCNTEAGICVCDDYYSGIACEIANIPCPGDCNAPTGGICDRSQGVCICYPTWSGENCDIRECINNCTGNGTCVAETALCDCYEGYEGFDCSFISCPTNCTKDWCNGTPDADCEFANEYNKTGACDFSSGTCVCKAGWTGDSCEVIRCPGDCSNNGVCIEGTCECDQRWEGSYCEIEKPDWGFIIALCIILAVVTLAILVIAFMIWRHFQIQKLTAEIANETEMLDQAISDSEE